MKITSTIVLLMFFCLQLFGQVKFQKTFSSSGNMEGVSILQLTNDDFLICANSMENGLQVFFTALNNVSNASSWFAIIDNIDNWNIELLAETKSNCQIEIFDAKGSLVYRMDKQNYSKGEKIAIAKRLISSGMNLLRIQSSNSVYNKKLLRF